MSTQKKTAASPSATVSLSIIDRFFHITERGSSITQEVRGGFVTLFAMAYILVVNPIILSTILSAEAGFTLADTATGTAPVASTITTLMGLIANFPLAPVVGIGPNAVVAFTLVGDNGLSYQEIMGLIVWGDILIAILVFTGFHEVVFKAVLRQLKTAISVGIGLFIAFVGLINADIIRPGNIPIQLGIDGSLAGLPALILVLGLLLMVVLYIHKVKGVILVGLLSSAVLTMILQAIFHVSVMRDETGEVVNPTGWEQTISGLSGSIVSLSSFDSLFQIDIFGALSKFGPVTVVLLVFSLMLADFPDTMGTMVAIGGEVKLLDENGNPPHSREVFLVDSLAAIVGGIGGVSSNTSCIELPADVRGGARTDLASVVTGLLLLASTFPSPLVALVPTEATSTVLVFVSFLMMMQVADIDWSKAEIAIPVFPAIALTPFAYSVTVNTGVGFITYMLIRIAKSRAKRAHLLIWLMSVLFIVYSLLDPTEALIG